MSGNGNGGQVLMYHSADEPAHEPERPANEPIRTITESDWSRFVSNGLWLLAVVFVLGILFGILTARLW